METQKIKPIDEINIGDTFVYTGNPRGTGLSPTETAKQFKVNNENDRINLAIQMIEQRHGWEKLISK